jgi:hypothetical protein
VSLKRTVTSVLYLVWGIDPAPGAPLQVLAER